MMFFGIISSASSGESFCRPGQGGLSVDEISRIARQAARVAASNVQLAIVVGGGNILRGAQFLQKPRVHSNVIGVDLYYLRHLVRIVQMVRDGMVLLADADLPRAERIVGGAAEVPIGAYTNRILDRAGDKLGADFVTRVQAKIV